VGGAIESVTIYPSNIGLQMLAKEETDGPQIASEETDGLSENEMLRRYQLRRLRYYFAVVVCDTPATAAALYAGCDGMEIERSANAVDLRFVPDDEKFTNPPKCVARRGVSVLGVG
jgi:hypothetical protein